MVDIEFDGDPASEEIEQTIERIEGTGKMARGITGGRSFDYDAESGVLKLNFGNLSKVP